MAKSGVAIAVQVDPDPVRTAYVLEPDGPGWALIAVPIQASHIAEHGEKIRERDSFAMCLATARDLMGQVSR
jgi:hypothetical protein